MNTNLRTKVKYIPRCTIMEKQEDGCLMDREIPAITRHPIISIQTNKERLYLNKNTTKFPREKGQTITVITEI